MKTIEDNLDITNLKESALPRALFARMKKIILGDSYELSLSFVSLKEIKKLSLDYKGDATHTNILSFPLSKNLGEIVVCVESVKKECLAYNRGCRQHLKYIVIHGMLHLAHHVHGSKMDSEEKRLMKMF